jgi:hypothetical protein
MIFLIMFLLALLSIASLAHATLSSDEKLASKFLGITGVNMNTCSISSFDESTSRMPNSPHYLTVMKAEISGNNTQFEVLMSLVDGKIWSYSLSGNFSTGQLNASANLIRANNSLKAYQAFSNASYCSKFVELLSTVMQTQNSSAENEDFALKISNSISADHNEYTTIHYSRKVKGYTLQGDCFAISMSKNGLLSSLLDNMMYYVATTDVNVSEEEATALATPYATVYANLHGQTIAATNATFNFARDVSCVRGDNFAIYPRWIVSFTFDKVNNESVSGYAVAVWADNGQVYYNEPQGSYLPSNIGLDANASWQIVAIATTLFVLFPIATTYVKHKARTGRSRK